MHAGEQLFRQESGRIVASLSRVFGLDHVGMAEDVAQDVFCRAIEVWKLRGVPPNPSAWLMKAAKNRAIDLIRREGVAQKVGRQYGALLESEWTLVPTMSQVFSAESIKDDELRMMFSCCNPGISEDVQIALVLRLLCGFSIAEIAGAFLSTAAAIEKRIERGKKALAAAQHLFEMSDAELPRRLGAVHRALYLLFNEGYHGSSEERAVRGELCREALRLAALLLDNALLATPASYALCALMSFHTARLAARVDGDGDLVALCDQDRSLWDPALIAQGNAFLERSATGGELSEYHVEAAIASTHAAASSLEDTDWARLVWLYDTLLQLRPSPVVALNRAIALGQLQGPERGIDAIRAIPDSERLSSYPFFQAALAELELRAGNLADARGHFRDAAVRARNSAERRFLELRAARAAP